MSSRRRSLPEPTHQRGRYGQSEGHVFTRTRWTYFFPNSRLQGRQIEIHPPHLALADYLPCHGQVARRIDEFCTPEVQTEVPTRWNDPFGWLRAYIRHSKGVGCFMWNASCLFKRCVRNARLQCTVTIRTLKLKFAGEHKSCNALHSDRKVTVGPTRIGSLISGRAVREQSAKPRRAPS